MDTTTVVGTRLDYWIIVGYFVLIFSFGFYFGRFTRSTKEFFMGGQRFSWWLITFSCVATVVGSYSFIKYSAAGFRYGTSSTMTYLNDWIVMSFLLLGWLPIIYFNRFLSVPDYFRKRFDDRTGIMATIIVLTYMIGYIGINLYTMGVALNAMLGTDLMTSVIVVAVICAVYVTVGGQTSVIMTDLVQGVILLIAGTLLFVIGVGALGGLREFWAGLPLLHRFPFARFNEPHEFNFVGIFWQDGISNTFALYMMNQGFVLRFLSLKSVKETRKSFLALILILMPLAAFAVSNAGWLGRSMVSHGLLPADVDPNGIFVAVAAKIAGPGVFGFVMAALTAALMSTIDTLINAVSAVTVNDIYRPYVRPKATDRHYLGVARVVSLSAAMLGLLLVPVFASFNSIYVAHGAFTASVTPAMVVAIVLAIYWRRYSPSAAFWTLLGGSLLVTLSIVLPVVVTPFSHGVDSAGGFTYTRALFGLAGSALIAILVTLNTRGRRDGELEGLVAGTLRRAMERFKGGVPNEEEGSRVGCLLKEHEGAGGLSVNREAAGRLKAGVGDIIYLSDARWWLGGLRSVHARLSAIRPDDDPTVLVAPSLVQEGRLLTGRRHKMEKIM